MVTQDSTNRVHVSLWLKMVIVVICTRLVTFLRLIEVENVGDHSLISLHRTDKVVTTD